MKEKQLPNSNSSGGDNYQLMDVDFWKGLMSIQIIFSVICTKYKVNVTKKFYMLIQLIKFSIDFSYSNLEF